MTNKQNFKIQISIKNRKKKNKHKKILKKTTKKVDPSGPTNFQAKQLEEPPNHQKPQIQVEGGFLPTDAPVISRKPETKTLFPNFFFLHFNSAYHGGGVQQQSS